MGPRPFNASAKTLIVAFAIAAASPLLAVAGQEAAAPSPDAAAAGALPWGPSQVVVFKGARRLALYRGGVFEREFVVVLGLQPQGRKRHAHDARTPEGLYHVVGKSRHQRWQHFVAIDYPNARDRELYADEVREGRVPLEADAPFGIGGEVGIHGNDKPGEQAAGVDWTKGCVAMRPEDIAVVAGAVDVGTPVWIVP